MGNSHLSSPVFQSEYAWCRDSHPWPHRINQTLKFPDAQAIIPDKIRTSGARIQTYAFSNIPQVIPKCGQGREPILFVWENEVLSWKLKNYEYH